jgi:SAM-dependent methyltransferase
MRDWLRAYLRCPYDGGALQESSGGLVCGSGHRFPVVRGTPVLLVDDPDPTLWVARASLAAAQSADSRPAGDLFLDTLGITDAERRMVLAQPAASVDPVVSIIIPATSGYLYLPQQGKFTSYPIPELRLPDGEGRLFVELGCNWGRWCIAAARKGYRVVGIDPSLGAVLAARRVADSLGLEAEFVVADARHLPFAEACVDTAFSYSVLQHFSKANAVLALEQIHRVLKPGGTSFVQMPNQLGVRCLYNQARRRFAEPKNFDVRFWRVAELEAVFGRVIGPSTVSVDGFFGLGIQSTDVEHMPLAYRIVCHSSDLLRRASRAIPALIEVADSLYVTSTARG